MPKFQEAAPVLIEVLRAERLYWPKQNPQHNTYPIRINRQQEEYLARFHCASALLEMLGLPESSQALVQLAADHPARLQNVERVAKQVEKRLSDR